MGLNLNDKKAVVAEVSAQLATLRPSRGRISRASRWAISPCCAGRPASLAFICVC